MQCFQHRTDPAVGLCLVFGRGICGACAVEAGAFLACRGALAGRRLADGPVENHGRSGRVDGGFRPRHAAPRPARAGARVQLSTLPKMRLQHDGQHDRPVPGMRSEGVTCQKTRVTGFRQGGTFWDVPFQCNEDSEIAELQRATVEKGTCCWYAASCCRRLHGGEHSLCAAESSEINLDQNRHQESVSEAWCYRAGRCA